VAAQPKSTGSSDTECLSRDLADAVEQQSAAPRQSPGPQPRHRTPDTRRDVGKPDANAGAGRAE
jgi:hypothetical protein